MPLGSLKSRWDYSRWLWSMGASPQDSLGLVTAYNSRLLRRRLGLLGVRPTTARLRVGGTPLPFRFCSASDFAVFGELFRDRQYELSGALAPRTILDLGANSGLSALFFHSRFPAAIIFAIEAHPTTFALLEQNAAMWQGVRPVHLAATGRNGTVEFYGTADQSISSSLFHRRQTDRKTQVPSEDLSTLVERCGGSIDLLKFDIEGAEFDLFSHFNEWDRIGVMIGEIHPDLYGGTPEQFFALFPRHSHQILARFGERLVARFDPKRP